MTPDTELLWRELRDRLHAFIARRVDNPADVEDLLQEVFLRIHQHLSTVRDTGRLTPWIFQLTRNAITDYYRAAPRWHEIPGNVPHDGELGKGEREVDLSLNSDEHPSHNHELVPCLTPLIERLPEHYREAVLLVELEGLPQRELSERLAVSLSGAKSRVQLVVRSSRNSSCAVARSSWINAGTLWTTDQKQGVRRVGRQTPRLRRVWHRLTRARAHVLSRKKGAMNDQPCNETDAWTCRQAVHASCSHKFPTMQTQAQTFLPGLVEGYLGRQALPMTKELAVLFVDIADSTSTLLHHPPAHALAMVQHFSALVTDIALAHCGDVKDYEGDGALLYFGALRQAVRAALAIREALVAEQKAARSPCKHA